MSFLSRSQQWRRPADMPATGAGWTPPVHAKVDMQVTCWLYVNLVWDPDQPNAEMIGYIGESTDPPRRQVEHEELDRWGDTMTRTVVAGRWPGDRPYVIEHVAGLPPVPGWVFDIVRDQVASSKRDIWAIERAAVVRYRPPYNGEYNYANPDRITMKRQAEQRAERDAARGLPPEQTWAWQHAQREAGKPRPSTFGGLFGAWRSTPRWARRAAQWAVRWAVIAAIGWLLLAQVFHGVGWRLGGLSGVACALLLLWWRWGRRRWPRGMWRRSLLALSQGALVLLGVWLLLGAVMSAAHR